MPSPNSLAHRATCATPSSPPWSTLHSTMPSSRRVITEPSLPGGRAERRWEISSCSTRRPTHRWTVHSIERVDGIDQLARSSGADCQLLDRASRSIVTDDEYHGQHVHPVLPSSGPD